MLELHFRLVKADEVERLREWMAELNGRMDEVRETFRNETVRHEVAYLIRGSEGPILVYAIEAEDPDHGHRAAATSTLPIDVQHREVMGSVLEGPAQAEWLYECRLEG
jgi:Family of unknown function (DUF6176)